MNGFNSITLFGKCGRFEPKVIDGQYGKYAYFTLEIPRNYTLKSGETKEFTDYITIKAEKTLATVVENMVHPDTIVLIHGRLRVKFEADKDSVDGKKHEKHEVLATEIIVNGRTSNIEKNNPFESGNPDAFPVENGEFKFEDWG